MRGRPGTQRSRRKPAYRRQAVGHGLSTRKGWVQNRPLISLLRRQLPPKGKPLDVTGQPSLSRLYETPPPARPAGGRAVTGVGSKVVGKRRTHLSWFQKTREGGSREEETPPPWCSFLHFSQEKWRPPAGIPPGRCAPRPVKAPTTRRVPTTGGEAPKRVVTPPSAPSHPWSGAYGWPWRAPPPRRPPCGRSPSAGRGPGGCPPPAGPRAGRRRWPPPPPG